MIISRSGNPETHVLQSTVGPRESHTHLTRTGLRPAIAGYLAADAAHSTRFATHGQQPDALGYVAGVLHASVAANHSISTAVLRHLPRQRRKRRRLASNPIEFRVRRCDQR